MRPEEPRCGLPSCRRPAAFAASGEAGTVVLCARHLARLRVTFENDAHSPIGDSPVARRLAAALAGAGGAR